MLAYNAIGLYRVYRALLRSDSGAYPTKAGKKIHPGVQPLYKLVRYRVHHGHYKWELLRNRGHFVDGDHHFKKFIIKVGRVQVVVWFREAVLGNHIIGKRAER
jgi:hypothetical protein